MIFDSGLDQLQLPILPSLSFDDPSDSEHHRGTLAVLLERYMEWKVEFPESELGFLGALFFDGQERWLTIFFSFPGRQQVGKAIPMTCRRTKWRMFPQQGSH